MKAEFITPEDRRWSDFLEQAPYDFYHLPEYVRFAARYEGGTPIAFLAQEGGAACLIPLVRRTLPAFLKTPAEWSDVCSPYGCPSPLLVGDDRLGLDYFLPAFLELGRKSGIVTAFLRFHPLFPQPMGGLGVFGELVEHGPTVFIDLGRSSEDIWRNTRKNHRSGIKKLMGAGYRAVVNDWNWHDDFKKVYRQTMHRVGAGEYYHFSDEYFDQLREVLKEKINLCVVIAPTGDLASACLFTTCKGVVEVFLAGTENKYFEWAPTKLMFDCVRRWAKDLGHSLLHFGGGVGAEPDHLYHFKAGFSNQRGRFFTFRLIFNHQVYTGLCTKAQEVFAGDSADQEQFFPGYRLGKRST